MGFLIVGCSGGVLFAATALYMSAPLWLAFLAYSFGGATATLLAAVGPVALRASQAEQREGQASSTPAE